MATSDDSPETSSDIGTRMAKVRSKMKAFANHNSPGKQEIVNIVIEDSPRPELDKSGKGPNRLRMEQVQASLKVVKEFHPTQLGGSWLHDMLPEKPQRKLHAAVHRFEDRAFFILTTKPLPPRSNITSADGYAQILRSLREKKWSPNDITYVFTKNEHRRWVMKDEATQPVIDTMRIIMEHYPEPLSRVRSRWMQQLYTSCVLAALPDPYRSGAFVLPKLNWDASRNAIQVNLDIPASNTSVAVKNEPLEYSHPLEIWITKDVPGDCAKLEIDPVFRIKESREVQRKATAAQRGLAKFVAQKCAQNTMNQGEAMILGQALASQYGKKRKNKHTGRFRSENMVRLCDIQNFGPSRLVKEACPDLPNIFVGSQASRPDWKFHIAQAAHIRFAETGNVTEAWEAACETADLLLDLGQELLFLPCSEAETEKAHTLHACYGCWFPWPCVKLTLIINRRYCPLCINAIAFEERSRERDMIPLVTPYRQFTYGQIAAEWYHLGVPTDIQSQERRQMEIKFPKVTVASLGSEEKAILWEDAYSTEDLDPRREKSKSRALIPSIEAVLPIFRTYYGSSRIHVPTNMVSTAFYLDLLKGIFPPIVLKIIHMIYNTSQEDTEALRELIKRLDHIYLIRLQVPYKKNGRFTHSMKPQSFEDFKRQCQSGIASASGSNKIPNGKLWNYKGFGKMRSAGTLTDDSISSRLPQLKEVKEILLKLEHITGQKLHRISDVPYPFQGGPEPKVWSWGILYQFLGLRLRVLRWACNKRWVTDLTVPILIVVLCYQVLERQRKKSEMQWPECQEFLRLPISLYQMHPLSVSIGKADHSLGMVSGFKSGSMLSLENFDPERCNLLFETLSSNCAKSNFDADVDQIIKHFTETLRKEALPYWPADLAPLPPDGTIPQMQSVSSPLDEATDSSFGDGPDNVDDLEEMGEQLLEKLFYVIDSDERLRVVQSKQKDYSIKQGQQKGQQEGLQTPLKQTGPPARKHSRPLTSESTAELRGIRKGFPLASIVEEDAPSDDPLSLKEQREKAYDTPLGRKTHARNAQPCDSVCRLCVPS
ncbi:hypothetical protein DIS24_g6982 [Lasiodiplodia hormozganensis]|uniref:Uncharacterized protein n=1 Tax=Lasiodiplodia hormozganensis TaxID=869390 RepID=A0AA39YCX8_9PEZI|nr:hypothetical protein DIS24_g6982 [Lasiodiplodia hormozganensis]